jgi:hypothetical protein
MNKLTAHIILGVLDIGALVACFYVFTEWNDIAQQINVAVDRIVVQNLIGLYTMMIVVPVTHVLSLFQWQEIWKRWINRFLMFFFLLVVIGAFSLSYYFENKLLTGGYRYCAKQSEMMTFSKFKTYIREDLTCSD